MNTTVRKAECSDRGIRGAMLIAMWVVAVALSAARADTTVCGPIFNDTTWTMAGSPYVLTCPVSVVPEATLTISAGVSVLFHEDVSLGGRIVAIGTEKEHIGFTSINPDQPGAGVDALGSNQTYFEYCDFSFFEFGLDINALSSDFTVAFCTFSDNSIGLGAYVNDFSGVFVNHCLFQSNWAGLVAGGALVQDTSFINNFQGINFVRGVVQNCYFSGNHWATRFSCPGGFEGPECTFQLNEVLANEVGLFNEANGVYAHILQNMISDNGVGLDLLGSFSGDIRNNSITSNGIGVRIGPVFGAIEYNDFCDNDLYSMARTSASFLLAPNNYWGSNTTSEIDAVIFDGHDDSALGVVIYEPFLAEPYLESTECGCNDANDADCDGVANEDDNCPSASNPEQTDFDEDGAGDGCDEDVDGDGVSNGVDVCDGTPMGTGVDMQGRPWGDLDHDCDTDLLDYQRFQQGFTGATLP